MQVRVTGGSRSGGATLSRLSLVIQGCPGHSGAIKVASALCASTTSNTRGISLNGGFTKFRCWPQSDCPSASTPAVPGSLNRLWVCQSVPLDNKLLETPLAARKNTALCQVKT